jgi:hypothetical protein
MLQGVDGRESVCWGTRDAYKCTKRMMEGHIEASRFKKLLMHAWRNVLLRMSPLEMELRPLNKTKGRK